MRRYLLAVLAIPASLFPLPASRASVFVATVANAVTNGPVADADVTITDLRRTVRTNWIGEGTIADVSTGRHHVRVRRIGYVDAELDVAFEKDTVGLFFDLSPQPQSMKAVNTTAKATLNARMSEFEVRRRALLGLGRFLTDSVLQLDSTMALARILEKRLPGLNSIGDDRTVKRFNCGTPAVYIDGLPTSLSRRSGDVTDLRLFSGADVAGVEYYSQAVHRPISGEWLWRAPDLDTMKREKRETNGKGSSFLGRGLGRHVRTLFLIPAFLSRSLLPRECLRRDGRQRKHQRAHD